MSKTQPAAVVDDLALDLAMLDAHVTRGRSDAWLKARGYTPAQIAHARRTRGKANTPSPAPWTKEEDRILDRYLLEEGYAGIAKRLGRSTPYAVYMRRRKAGIPGILDRVEMSVKDAAWALGINEIKVANLVDLGLMPGYKLPTAKTLYNVPRRPFLSWAVNPDNWVHFDPEAVNDIKLLTLLPLAVARWGDKWLTTPEIAARLGCDTDDITGAIRTGRLPARQPLGYGSDYYVKASDLKGLYLRHERKPKPGDPYVNWDRDAFLILAYGIGLPLPWVDMVAKRRDRSSNQRIQLIRRNNYAPWLIKEYGLPLQITDRGIFGYWQDATQRIPSLPRTVDRFLAKKPLGYWGKLFIGGIVARWVQCLGPEDANPGSYRRGIFNAKDRTIRLKAYAAQEDHGIKPFGDLTNI